MRKYLSIAIILLYFSISAQAGPAPAVYDTSYRVIHVMVALCDNDNQGIVPVPRKIGNGQDPANNLYWGCGYGIRTFFKRSAEWREVKTYDKQGIVLQRAVFVHKTRKYYLIADAYDGKEIKQCTEDFLNGCAGRLKDTLHVGKRVIGTAGNAQLLAYIGHDGLMDFRLQNDFERADSSLRYAIILACAAKPYFTPFIRKTGAVPLLWTTGLMCPEAYTLHDALSTHIAGGSPENVRTSAAKAYNRYQKCGERGARNLLVTGW